MYKDFGHIDGIFKAYQESMTPEVQKRLAEITVDIKTVSLSQPQEKK